MSSERTGSQTYNVTYSEPLDEEGVAAGVIAIDGAQNIEVVSAEPEFAAASAFAKNTRDVTEFLAALGLSAPLKPLAARVTYQDSCHLLHSQKIREAPRQLLHAIPGLEFVELPFADICCGSAGVYNVTQTHASLDLLAEKMACAKSTGAQIITTANPGCLLQLRAGAQIHQTGQEVLHVIELLDRASRWGG